MLWRTAGKSVHYAVYYSGVKHVSVYVQMVSIMKIIRYANDVMLCC